MGVAEKMTISDNTAKVIGNGLAEGSFKMRMIAYIFMYIPFFVLFSISFSSFLDHQGIKNYGGIFEFIYVIFLFFSASLPFYLIEKMIRRRRRRKEGLPIYESIDKILKQRAIDERVAMEVKAHEKVSPSKDLNYYFELLKKGAITQEEYDAKKQSF